jgi:ubiquinone/menaquinone biosynthesis C-methylase UbiE
MNRLQKFKNHLFQRTCVSILHSQPIHQRQQSTMSTSKQFDAQTSAIKLFKSRADQYEKITGGCTRRIAEAGLAKLPPLTSGSRILDSAAGPGIVTALVLDKAREQGISPMPYILATDFSEAMIDQLNANKEAGGWDTVEAKVLDSQNLQGVESNSFDALFMNFALFALPDAAKGTSEMLRVLKPGGVAIVTTWKHASTVVVMEAAVKAIRPEDIGRVFPISRDWLTQEKLRDTMVAGGFKDAKVDIWEQSSVWKNDQLTDLVDAFSAEFWAPIWKGWSAEEKGRWGQEIVNALTEEQKANVALDMHAWMCYAVKE